MNGSARKDEDFNLLLLKQQIPYMLNVSHYMTDLVYVLYYTIKLQDNEEEIIELEGRKTMLCDDIYKLREHFRILLSQSSGSILGIIQDDTDEKQNVTVDKDSESKEEVWRLIQQFKNLITEELLQIVNDINRLIIEKLDEIKSDDKNLQKLVIQLDNCFYGFLNLNNFIRRIPSSKTFNSDNQNSMKSIVNVIKDELLLSWKIELDLLNCKIFSLISNNEKILNLFRQYQLDNGQQAVPNKKQQQDTVGSIKEDSETFIQLISWLKDDQVFGSLVL